MDRMARETEWDGDDKVCCSEAAEGALPLPGQALSLRLAAAQFSPGRSTGGVGWGALGGGTPNSRDPKAGPSPAGRESGAETRP